jgi:hypothetical protein
MGNTSPSCKIAFVDSYANAEVIYHIVLHKKISPHLIQPMIYYFETRLLNNSSLKETDLQKQMDDVKKTLERMFNDSATINELPAASICIPKDIRIIVNDAFVDILDRNSQQNALEMFKNYDLTL